VLHLIIERSEVLLVVSRSILLTKVSSVNPLRLCYSPLFGVSMSAFNVRDIDVF